MDMNISTDKMPHYTDFSLLQNLYLTLKYLLSNILQKLLSVIDIISENCRTLHLYPPTVNVIQTVTQSVQSVSARLLIYCELLYWQRRTLILASLSFLTLVHTHLTYSVNTEHCEAQYNANSLSAISLTESICGTIRKLCVWDMSNRKCTYRYVLIVPFWKFLDSAEFIGILFVIYIWHLFGMLLFNNHLLRF
jgi:hypothetical protein